MKHKILCMILVLFLTIPTVYAASSKYRINVSDNHITNIKRMNKDLTWKQWEENLYKKFVSDLVFKTWTEMPLDYVFKVSFDVDDERKISNIRIKGKREDCIPDELGWKPSWCYSPFIESDADLLYKLKYYSHQILKSYEGTNILKFPKISTVKNKSVTIFSINTIHALDKKWNYEEMLDRKDEGF